MALDPRISLGVQPVQLANPLDQYGKIAALQQAQNQNALAQYQLGAAQRADEQAQNRLRLFQEAGGDPGKVANAFLQSGDWKGYTELTKNQSEKRAADLKFNADLAQRAASIYSTVKDEPTWQMARQKLAALGGDASTLPTTYDPAFVQSEIQQAFSIKDLAERVLTPQSFGGTNRVISTPKYALPGTTPTAEVVQGSVGKVTMTEAERAADARARQRLAFDIGQASPAAVEAKAAAQARGTASGQGAGKPVFKDGQWIVAPTDMKPGEAREIVNPTAAKDAKDALTLIDQATKLIPKATGSYLGNALDTVAQAIGYATGGAQTTAQLQALEGALVSKMPKMSGPQSDSDVKLYKQMAGNIGNPNVPPSIKQEALKTIKEIQERYAGVPKAGGGAFTQQQPASKPPAGIDAALWNVMTPQERALWQK